MFLVQGHLTGYFIYLYEVAPIYKPPLQLLHEVFHQYHKANTRRRHRLYIRYEGWRTEGIQQRRPSFCGL